MYKECCQTDMVIKINNQTQFQAMKNVLTKHTKVKRSDEERIHHEYMSMHIKSFSYTSHELSHTVKLKRQNCPNIQSLPTVAFTSYQPLISMIKLQ